MTDNQDPDAELRMIQAMDELALRDRAIAEVTGEEPPIELRFFYGEIMTLLRLLNAIEMSASNMKTQATSLIETIKSQMEGRWDSPEGWTPPPPTQD